MRQCQPCGRSVCGSCWLYVVADRSGGYPVKVGISNHPVRRLGQHRKDRRRDLYLAHRVELRCQFDAAAAEALALAILEPRRTRGDWFDCSPALVIDVINSVHEGMAA
ncbi:GIY-YIG nuclease family protein [Bradyrhizobium sp. AUGA SZCCT0176]|uniref:GIY-YIG nuclease family protein n=1 Tax=Bradyrhizobium sp. AUGA SZCCT0176 TaxID=2807664 RepID=UPI001BAE20C5|nr:GIY-YIG nuclease family protein [Bradyrhizobium sp. AUGA SZCCT0176]